MLHQQSACNEEESIYERRMLGNCGSGRVQRVRGAFQTRRGGVKRHRRSSLWRSLALAATLACKENPATLPTRVVNGSSMSGGVIYSRKRSQNIDIIGARPANGADGTNTIMSLIAEFKRRNVFKVAVAYVIVAWLTIQAIDVLVQLMGMPDWIGQALVLLLVVSFPVALVFAWAFELTPDGLKREHEVERPDSITQQTGRKLDFVIIGVLLIALAFFVVDKYVPSPAPDLADTTLSTSPVEEAAFRSGHTETVAVIPFVDLSPNADQEWIGATIATEMQTELSKRSDLQVLSRSSSFAIPPEAKSSQDIGRFLGVDVLVEGTVRRIGDRIRVTVQLVSVADGYQLWSDVYEARLSDDFSAEIAISEFFSNQVRDQLAAPFTPTVQLSEFSQAPISSFASVLGSSMLPRKMLDTYVDPVGGDYAEDDTGQGGFDEE